jgi:hypothetical protein
MKILIHYEYGSRLSGGIWASTNVNGKRYLAFGTTPSKARDHLIFDVQLSLKEPIRLPSDEEVEIEI